MRRIVTLLYLLLLAATSWAGDVSLAWDQSISPGITGNKVYYGQASGLYLEPIVLPPSTTYTVTGLAPGTWFFAVTAVDASAESDVSNEVSTTIATENRCDINGDGSVNVLDMQRMAAAIVAGTASVDLNGDGTTNVLDLQILAGVIVGSRSCP